MNRFREKIKSALENSDLSQFKFKEVIIAGDECIFVNTERAGVSWNKHNLCLRSVIYRKSDYYPISLGFKKFFNWNEQPDLVERPESLGGCNIVSKLDGSCLIVSRYKGELIVRTRGTVNARLLSNNGFEVSLFEKKYPKVFDFGDIETGEESFIYEWTSPNQRIVIDYGKVPKLKLIGIINHKGYNLTEQPTLNMIAPRLGVERPQHRLSFDSIDDLLFETKNLVGEEGVCLYSHNGQNIHKIKGDWYRALHFLKSELSLKGFVDLFFSLGKNYTVDELKKIIKDKYDFRVDFEQFEILNSYIEKVVERWGILSEELRDMSSTISLFKKSLTDKGKRKDIAASIIKMYKKTGLSGIAFAKLDGKKGYDDEILKKILLKRLKS